jgi:hypothetical protein
MEARLVVVDVVARKPELVEVGSNRLGGDAAFG